MDRGEWDAEGQSEFPNYQQYPNTYVPPTTHQPNRLYDEYNKSASLPSHSWNRRESEVYKRRSYVQEATVNPSATQNIGDFTKVIEEEEKSKIKGEASGQGFSLFGSILWFCSITTFFIPNRFKLKLAHALGVMFSMIFSLILFVLPKRVFVKAEEDGTNEPVTLHRTRWWWRENKRAFFAAVLFTALMLVVVFVVPVVRQRLRVIEVYDKVGKPIYNIQKEFVKRKDFKDWMENLDVKTVKQRRVNEEEVASGFVSTLVRDIGIRNVSLDEMKGVMEGMCKQETCRCISAMHIGIPKNVILLNLEGQDNATLFLINTEIASESSKTIKVAYHTEDTDHQELHNVKSWVERPASIGIEFNNGDNKLSRKVLTPRSSACVYEVLQILN